MTDNNDVPPYDHELEDAYMHHSITYAEAYADAVSRQLKELAESRPQDPDCKQFAGLAGALLGFLYVKRNFAIHEYESQSGHGTLERECLNGINKEIEKFLKAVDQYKKKYNANIGRIVRGGAAHPRDGGVGDRPGT